MLVGEAVFLHQRLAVQAERLGVRTQEALHERRAREQAPLFVLQRAQVLGPDLRLGLDLRHIDGGAHTRVAQRFTDLGHIRLKASRSYWRRARPTRRARAEGGAPWSA